MTNPDCPGTEKLAVCKLMEPRTQEHERLWNARSKDVGAASFLAPPMCVFNIKGWTRSLAATVVLRCAYEIPEFKNAAWHA